MPSKNPAQRLADIIENIAAIRQFTLAMSLKDFVADKRTTYAVTRALEIISEAAKRLPDDLKCRYPNIDWQAVAAAGNVYRHDYEVVDEEILWQTIQHGLTGLEEAVRRELDNY